MKRIILFFAVLFSLAAMPAASAMAASVIKPISDACHVTNGSNSPGNSSLCSAPATPVAGPGGTLAKVTHLISVFAGAVAIIIIVVSGLFFVTAEGDSSKAASARSTLIGAAVGLAIIVAAQPIINFVLTKV